MSPKGIRSRWVGNAGPEAAEAEAEGRRVRGGLVAQRPRATRGLGGWGERQAALAHHGCVGLVLRHAASVLRAAAGRTGARP